MSRPALSEQQINRLLLRIKLFVRRGMSPNEAESTADRLATRDMDGDDRRMCIECDHMRRDRTCFQASIGKLYDLPAAPKVFSVLPTTLQRCCAFSFAMP